MNLQSYIADFIDIVNNIFIPFMLGMAFLVFVINVFRFFVVGGSNTDSQEKAKSLAIYGVGAFVFIIIFWGIVNLLTSSLGLTRVGDSTPRCFDYGPSDCGVIAGNFVGDGIGDDFGGGVGDLFPPEFGGGTGLPDSPDFVSPTPPDTPTMPGLPDQPPAPPTINTDAFPELSIDVTTSDNSDLAVESSVMGVASDFIDRIPNFYNWNVQPVIEASVAAITDPQASNEERAIAAIRLANHNQLTDADLVRYIDVLNSDQTDNFQAELDLDLLTSQASQSPTADTLRSDTYNTIIANISLNDASFWTTEAAEQEEAARQAYTIRDTAGDIERVIAFDAVMADKARISPALITAMRSRLIASINVDRFFQGLPPLSETVPTNCSGSGPC